MNIPPDECNPKIMDVLRGSQGKMKEWLSHANRFIQVYYANIKIKPSAEDIVGDLIVKIYQKNRRWNYEKIDINSFMYNAIRSHVCAEAKKVKKLVTTDEYDSEEFIFKNKYENEYHISLREIEFLQDIKEKMEIVLGQIKGDEDCEIIFYCLLEGLKPRHIADDLGISVREVSNIMRRIKYKVQRALEQKTD
ncbi:MAG: sigma-70 family RNA polymerase sigma factor [Ignavibacteriales bacterium]|nr:MAG: sigma-70 family RNA polymerase sigma factor [Ignavibacteriales bacterium]